MRSKTAISIWMLIAAGFLLIPSTSYGQAQGSATGVISGSVTADKGDVRAVRVKATDTVHKIAYTVFTNKGKYQIYNLPSSNYQVTALQDGFASTSASVDLKTGETKSADLALTAKAPKSDVELADVDTVFPPSPARDILFRECEGCHALEHIPWQKMPHRSEEDWRVAISHMFEPLPVRAIPMVSPEAVTQEQRDMIAKYFGTIFGENTPKRDLKLSPLNVDENDLSSAIWIQYALPPAGKNAAGADIRRRGTHDVYPSEVSSYVWAVDTNTGSILGLDRNNPDYQERWREFLLPSPNKYSVHPHGIIENRGHVFWTELDHGAIGELDPKTGEVHQYMPPTPSAPHTLRADSKGNIWYSSLYNVGKIGMLDVKTKKITEYIPAPQYKNTHYYGMTVDKKDRVWAVGMTASMLVGYDPRTERWTVYPTPTPASGPRRPSVAPDGKIWFSENTGDGIGVLDPDTGKITEYKSPFKYGGEYECFAAPDGNIWVTALAYETLVKFNPKTLKYTYYRDPEPANSGRIPKLEVDDKGNIWGAMGANVINFKPNGNVPPQQSAHNM